MAGDLDGALAAVTEGLEMIDETGERWWEAELHRLRGLLLMARRDIPGAEVTLQRAIDLARANRQNRWNCAPPPALRGCGASKAGGPRPPTFWRRFMAGSPRGSIRPI